MKVTFLCPSSAEPIGGNIALYHFANSLSRRGHDIVVAHLRMWGQAIEHESDVDWFDFEPGITHWFDGDGALEPADAVVGTGLPHELGLPVLIVQGIDMLHPWLERKGLRTPSRKVCVASWLADVGTLFGVPRDQFAVVPCGIDHEMFRTLDPAAPRPIDVAALSHHHEAKGWDVAAEALRMVVAERPGTRAVVFGARPPDPPVPEPIEVRVGLVPAALATEVYNRTKVFLQASHYEGFGLTAIEAMACGAALVTTDNGGSRDYAFDRRTALVCEPGHPEALAERVLELLADADARDRMAAAGRAHVQSFDWDRSGALLETAIEEYLADPGRFLVEPGEDLTRGAQLAVGDVAATALAAGATAPARAPARAPSGGPEEADLVFNVVWTGTTFELLHPFTTSLLDHSAARFRFVANACPPDAVAAMERYAATWPGRVVEVLEVSTDRMLRHGTALDQVLAQRDDGSHFCFVDPDILARGPWLGPFVDALREVDVVTSGRELWSDHNVRPVDHPGVNGEYFFDADGFVFGSPHLAMYRREALTTTCERWGVGLGSTGNDIPEATRARLVKAGRSYWVYDTAKLVNILLQLDGHRLRHLEQDELLHVGGVAHFLAPPSTAPAAAGKPVAWGEGDAWAAEPALRGRHALASYTASLMTARAAGQPAPPVPDPDDADLAPRYAALRAAVEGMDLGAART